MIDFRAGCRRVSILIVLLSAFALAGCGIGTGTGHDSNDGGVFNDGGNVVSAADMSGSWAFSAAHNDPPGVVDCSGDLSVADVCGFFVVPVAQNGSSFSGNGANSYCSQTFDVFGDVLGNSVAGTFVSNDGSAVARMTFTGTVDGNSAAVSPTEIRIDGIDGSCTLSGTYIGDR